MKMFKSEIAFLTCKCTDIVHEWKINEDEIEYFQK